MDGNGHLLSRGARTSNMSNNDPGMMFPGMPTIDDNEADVLNDETFGDCDLEAIKSKSDFGENGEFLGDNNSAEGLPDFFDSDLPDTGEGLSLMENDDQSQSIDALLGEDPMCVSIRQSTMNPLFNMAISQARDGNIFPQQQQQQQPIPRVSPTPLPPQQQINYQFLKQFEQSLINRRIPPQERIVYIQAMIDKMQRDAMNIQQQTTRMTNLNLNGHNIYNRQQQQQQQPTQPMAIGEMMERARLTAMNNDTARSQSPSVGISSQLMDAIQRSDQIPQHSSSPPVEPTVVSHHGQSRHNRSTRHYPRPPLLNTWQSRGSGHDEFAGLMGDREKQWVVKIQLHQVSQTQDEDYYFHKWSQQKQPGNQLNRHDHRGQKISYPVLQLLKSIQQEKELAQRLSQSSNQATFSNVNPSQSLPYASPLHTQLGKQSTTTPRHPRCTLHLDGQFSLGTQANAITHNKYNLGILLHIENLRGDILQLEHNDNELNSIINRYLNDSKYFFPDIFGQFSKGRIIYERLHRYLIKSTENHLELMLIRLYGSFSYMIQQWPRTFSIEPIVMNTISLMQQQINVKKITFEQLLAQVYAYYNERIKPKLGSATSSSPFSDPSLFTNSQVATILIEFLLILERQCYLLSSANSSTLPIQIMQQLQPQLQYQLSEYVRLFINDLSEALITCSSIKKILKPFAQIHQQQFALLCKFLRLQTSAQIYAILEPKLIVFSLFGESNPFHVDVFPDIRTMEAEVVRCVATMFHGDSGVCGTMTSGGTESLLMACKTYRDLAYCKGITRPEM